MLRREGSTKDWVGTHCTFSALFFLLLAGLSCGSNLTLRPFLFLSHSQLRFDSSFPISLMALLGTASTPAAMATCATGSCTIKMGQLFRVSRTLRVATRLEVAPVRDRMHADFPPTNSTLTTEALQRHMDMPGPAADTPIRPGEFQANTSVTLRLPYGSARRARNRRTAATVTCLRPLAANQASLSQSYM